MNRKLLAFVLALGLLATLAFVGCKDNNNDTPETPAIVGHWVASNPIQVLGLDQYEAWFNADNSYRQFGALTNPTFTYDERGTWQFTNGDSIRFVIQTVDGQPPQGINNYSVTHHLTSNNNTLTLQIRTDTGPVNVDFLRQ
jgi:hypothetical protein